MKTQEIEIIAAKAAARIAGSYDEHHIEAIIQAAIDKATERILDQMDFLAKDLAQTRAAQASEP